MAAKSRDYAGISGAADVMKNILVEVESQKTSFKEWGDTMDEVENTPESPATNV